MAKKGKTLPKNKKKPIKKKKSTKPQKQERDLMWLFLKLLLVIAIVVVIIILVKRYSKPSTPNQSVAPVRELVEAEETTCQEVLIEELSKEKYVASEDGHLLAYQTEKEKGVVTEIWDFAKDSKRQTLQPKI